MISIRFRSARSSVEAHSKKSSRSSQQNEEDKKQICSNLSHCNAFRAEEVFDS